MLPPWYTRACTPSRESGGGGTKGGSEGMAPMGAMGAPLSVLRCRGGVRKWEQGAGSGEGLERRSERAAPTTAVDTA